MTEPTTTIRAIVFDWGGIFTEGTFDSSAVQTIVDRFGHDEEAVSQVYFPLMADFERGEFDFETFYHRLSTQLNLNTNLDDFRQLFLGAVRERTVMLGVLGIIPTEGYTVAMLSNNVPVLCDRVRDDLRMQRIEHFIFSNEIGVRKPDPEAFEVLLGRLELPAEAVVFIDDNEANIAAARELGLQGIHYSDFEGFKAQWNTLLPDLVLEDFQTRT